MTWLSANQLHDDLKAPAPLRALAYFVGNPSAWDTYDERVSSAIRTALDYVAPLVGPDTRPANCTNVLQEQGKAHPKSGCAACGSRLRGCAYQAGPPEGSKQDVLTREEARLDERLGRMIASFPSDRVPDGTTAGMLTVAEAVQMRTLLRGHARLRFWLEWEREASAAWGDKPRPSAQESATLQAELREKVSEAGRAVLVEAERLAMQVGGRVVLDPALVGIVVPQETPVATPASPQTSLDIDDLNFAMETLTGTIMETAGTDSDARRRSALKMLEGVLKEGGYRGGRKPPAREDYPQRPDEPARAGRGPGGSMI